MLDRGLLRFGRGRRGEASLSDERVKLTSRPCRVLGLLHLAALSLGMISCGAASDVSDLEPQRSSCKDLDSDGLAAADCGGGDCDDSDPARGGPDTNGIVGDWRATIAVQWDGPKDDSRDTVDLVLDDGGAAHVLVAGTYATNRTGAFVMESITGSKSHWWGKPALGVAAGVVHASFVDDAGVTYARRADGVWTQQRIADVEGGDSSLALDATGRPWIAYVSPAGLRLAHLAEQGWSQSQLFTAQSTESMFAVALAFDSTGQAHIVSPTCRDTECRVEYGRVVDGQWTPELVGTAQSIRAIAFALDTLDQPHVAFSSAAGSGPSLYYARRTASRWSVSPVDGGGWSSVDLAVSESRVELVSQAGGIAHVTLQDGAVVPDSRVTTATTGALCDCWGGVAIAAGRDGSTHIAFSGFNYSLGTHAYYSNDRTILPDGVDQNCDGVDGIDADSDGFASIGSGGLDCDDADGTVSSSTGCP